MCYYVVKEVLNIFLNMFLASLLKFKQELNCKRTKQKSVRK